MKKKELLNLGVPKGSVMRVATRAVGSAAKAGMDRAALRAAVASVLASPSDFLEDPHFANLAECLTARSEVHARFEAREEPAPYRQWGTDLDANAVEQMENACLIPVSVAGALMPDAHLGYGLPIGGVLATRNAVIPYAVGMDIACRMKMTVLDLPVSEIEDGFDRLTKALVRETSFGVGASFKGGKRREHAVMDEDWSVSPITSTHKDKAWSQLGTSGSGNHFVEYGLLTVEKAEAGLDPGTYLALLSHSGSRGVGAQVAHHYSRLAMDLHPDLPKPLKHLAWLDLDTDAGREYWRAMELMGRYASANHELIHRLVARRLGVEVLLDIENHHNFAWKEEHGGERVIVHRKGATPAGLGILGIIPGSMATPGYIVRGKGVAASLHSAAHGAGRRMSRKAAKQQFSWHVVKRFLEERGVRLLTAGLDEAPMAYKDIDQVMAAQSDLVEPLARFDPRIVKMAPGEGGRVKGEG